MRVIVGLGNPGETYCKTRHNAGFMVVDALVETLQAGSSRSFAQGALWELFLDGEKHLLFKPEVFMNRSGNSIKALVDYFNIAPDQVCIVADDVYIEPGSVRIRKTGSHGGHNGWKSVLEHIQPDNFWRVRIGVGIFEQDPELRMQQPPLDKYVLQPIPPDERKSVAEAIDKTVPNLIKWLQQGVLEESTVHI